jgi:hypothetical protein
MDCTVIGALPPTGTVPILIARVLRRLIIARVQGFKGSRVQGFKGSRVQGKEFIQEFTLQELFMQYCFLSGAMHPALSLGLF